MIATALILWVSFSLNSFSNCNNWKFHNYNPNGILKCNYQSKELFVKFIIERWIDARREIGLDRQYKNFFPQILKFNFYSTNIHMYLPFNGPPITYVRIYKCASDGIEQNLEPLLLGYKPPSPRSQIQIRMSTHFDMHVNRAMYSNDWNLDSLSNHSFKNFAYVRDPLQRFISGFTEIIARTATYKLKQPNKQENMTSIKYWLTKMISHSLEGHLIQLEHIYVMSGMLFEYPVDILGKVENIKADWENLIMPAYNIKRKYNEHLGDKGTSLNHPNRNTSRMKGDPNNARASLMGLMKTDPRYARAICHLILIDYICLPMYPLPDICSFLNATRRNAESALDKKTIIPWKFVE